MSEPASKKAERPVLVVIGDAQASAIARVLQYLPHIARGYDVELSGSANTVAGEYPNGSVLFEQTGEKRAAAGLPRGVTKSVQFPSLTFNVFWPLATVNPLNKPDPPEFPFGPFPYGDGFLRACLGQGVDRSEVLRLYFSGTWGELWPDLNALLAAETARLTALDSACKLSIGSYILTQFREQRLFLTPQAPTDVLLAELVTQLLARASLEVPAAAVSAALASFGSRDCMGILALPIHPLVAKHFELSWVSPLTRFNYFDREQITDREYYRRFIDHVLANSPQ